MDTKLERAIRHSKTLPWCKCGHKMERLSTEYKCPNCGKTRQRFIDPVKHNPLFLVIKPENEETKKFLEDIMQPAPKVTRYEKQGLFFWKDETGKIVDVKPVYKHYLERINKLVEEIKQRELGVQK